MLIVEQASLIFTAETPSTSFKDEPPSTSFKMCQMEGGKHGGPERSAEGFFEPKHLDASGWGLHKGPDVPIVHHQKGTPNNLLTRKQLHKTRSSNAPVFTRLVPIPFH